MEEPASTADRAVPDVGYDGDTEYGPVVGVGRPDAWGAVWTRANDDYEGQVSGHPLADWSAREPYTLPDPMQAGDFSRTIEMVRTNPGRKYLLVDREAATYRPGAHQSPVGDASTG
ncbi:MAG: hypothetical protein ACHQ7N_01115 [Candidatus Methylomirabilales bacterium]